MDITTVFGVKWRVASYPEFIIIGLIIFLVLIFVILLKYYQSLKNKKLHEYQLFLFRLKHLGLSNFQIKILNNMVEILKLQKPIGLLLNVVLFEKAVSKFLNFLKSRQEPESNMDSICKDITIIYDKLYNHSQFKKPLKDILDLEENQIIYFAASGNRIFLGKLISKNQNGLTIAAYSTPADLKLIEVDEKVRVHVWRIGDAEYEFETSIMNIEGTTIILEIPEELVRDKELRHPYINVIIPATLAMIRGEGMDDKKMPATIYKINDYEAVIRLSEKIDYKHKYILNFELMDFNFSIEATMVSEKAIEDGAVLYYSIKFDEMSGNAGNVLKKYIYEHL